MKLSCCSFFRRSPRFVTLVGATGTGKSVTIAQKTQLPAEMESPMKHGDFTYEVPADGTVLITGYTGSEREVQIPASIAGKNVTGIGANVFRNCTKLACITLPPSLTSIGNEAFYGCSSLAGLRLPASVLSIGNNAFNECTNLTAVTVPEGTVTLGRGVFSDCVRLADVSIPASVVFIGSDAFNGCRKLKNLQIAAENQRYVFYDGVLYDKQEKMLHSLVFERREFTVSEGVTKIHDCAFLCQKKLANLHIPQSVTAIGYGAFEACVKLPRLCIPVGVSAIFDSTFFYCRKLKYIRIPDSVTSITADAFDDCHPDLVIHCGENSYAHKFAAENKLKYKLIEPEESSFETR